jgi:hypothetical protein
MLLQSLRALYLAPWGPGSIWNYFGAPVRSTGVSGRFACGFHTDLPIADVNTWRDDIILEIDVFKELDADFDFPQSYLMSLWDAHIR